MNHLHYGDNLDILRTEIAPESVDLIYLDPPFNSNASYNVLFRSPEGSKSKAQIEAFDDTWHWGEDAESCYNKVLGSGNTRTIEMLIAMRKFLQQNDMMAYLAMMAVRLLELHKVLKPTGSLYLHCDPTASHYLKILLDSVFGASGYRSEISWKRSSAHSDAKQGRVQYGHIRDIIFFYTKSKKWTWNWLYTNYDQSYIDAFYKHTEAETTRKYQLGDLTAAKVGGDTRYEWRVKRPLDGDWEADLDNEHKKPVSGWEYKGSLPYGKRIWAYSKDNMRKMALEGRIVYMSTGMPRYKRYLDEMPGVPLQNDWSNIKPASSGEGLGYPTQKPLALLERIIKASSNEGDVVLDPFCGCGTAVHAAEKLRRKWIGIDITHLAISLIEKRLKDAFPEIKYDVHGTPKDWEGAEALARLDKYQFEWWAVSLVDAQPWGGKKKGADKGIDGVIYFTGKDKKTEKAIVSVKGGKNVGVAMIRDLVGVLKRENSPIGLFLTLAEPTRDMIREAAAAGIYDAYGIKCPRVQILTIKELLDGKTAKIPLLDRETFRQAPIENKEQKKLV